MNIVKEAVITAAYVNPPKPGKKNGTIKGADEILWLAKPPILAQFQQGGQYKISYEEYTIQGTSFKEIKAAEQVGVAPTATGSRSSARQDDGLAERIFVCGAINATLSNPTIDPLKLSHGESVGLVRHWRDVWANTFGKSPAKGDMDGDLIPY